MTDETKAPERIWIDWKRANAEFLAYDEEPQTPFSDCHDGYVRADLHEAALLAANTRADGAYAQALRVLKAALDWANKHRLGRALEHRLGNRAVRLVINVAPQDVVAQAARDVLAERARQVSAEGWTPEHDDTHRHGELAIAAAVYARHAGRVKKEDRAFYSLLPPGTWPWAKEWWKPSTPRRDLVKSCALCLAEIERLDRKEARALAGDRP